MRDSSLSAGTQAVVAAEVGHLDLAYDYLAEAALTDLHDVHNNVRNGLHMASLAGAWNGVVAGFGGMRDHNGEITFAPRLPPALSRIEFRMCVHGSRFAVEVHEDRARYRLVSGKPAEITHHGTRCMVAEEPVTLPIPPIDPGPAPSQPAGRAPAHRDPSPSPR